MQIYEKRNDKSYHSSPRCGYCRQHGHNKYNCPEVDKDWAWWKDFKVPVTTSSGWYMSRNNPKYWGEWYEKCKEIYEEKQRRANAPKAKRTKAEPKCGFCGEYGHNRRNCPEMEAFKQKCYKANENWRRAAYKELVEKHGICVGACVEVTKRQGWGSQAETTTEIAIITEVNFDVINVMATHDKYLDGYTNPYKTELVIKAMVNGQVHNLGMIKDDWTIDKNDYRYGFPLLSKELFAKGTGHSYYCDYEVSGLLSPSEHPLDEKWITDYKGAFDLLLKKRSKAQLDNDGVTSIIEEWAKKV